MTIVIASCLSAIGAARRADWAWIAMMVATATWAYPAIYSLSIAAAGYGGELSALLMLPTALTNLAITVAYRHREGHIDGRLARPSPAGWNVAKTLIELLLLWAAFLWLIPALVDRLELAAGWSIVVPDPSRVLGLGFLGAGTVLLVWSALVMAVRGQGTPFPFDAPRRLVIEGPYRYVRNPQVIGGVLQGVSLVLFEWSPLLVGYVVTGICVWHVLLRPWEEADLVVRFGRAFDDYRRSVPCWLPRLTPYHGRLEPAPADRPTFRP